MPPWTPRGRGGNGRGRSRPGRVVRGTTHAPNERSNERPPGDRETAAPGRSELRAMTADGRNALSLALHHRQTEIVTLLESSGAELPTPVEDDSLPWPDVGDDLSRVDPSSPESVLRAFILSMHRWELAAVAASRDSLDFDRIREAERAAFEPYCTVKERSHGRCGSFGTPPQYAPDEALISVTVVNTRRVELVTRQSKGRFSRSECRYVLLRKADRWLIDSLQTRGIERRPGHGLSCETVT